MIFLAAAFVAGLLTFFATCLLPVLPVYLAYLGGQALKTNDPSSRERRDLRSLNFWQRHLVVNSLVFIAGFIIVFVILGLSVTTIGGWLNTRRLLFQQLGGWFLIALGVYSLEIIKIPALFKSWQWQPPASLRNTKWGAFLLGVTFAFAWTPCIGPILGSILILASQSAERLYGVILLLVFGLGLALPFLLVGIFFQWLQPWLQKLGRLTLAWRWLFGLLMIFVGILLVIGRLGLLSAWALSWGVSPVLNFQGF